MLGTFQEMFGDLRASSIDIGQLGEGLMLDPVMQCCCPKFLEITREESIKVLAGFLSHTRRGRGAYDFGNHIRDFSSF